ncbi:RbsD/FucU family protein [Mariluticola halotolerans]|uniref:RbsD/FucU family protein n=1 Tax=Mariluticola halotolerans TaxID=2909283 RepID=UPI0026E1EC89|nr:RbsD/FucU domain-containing protein [Mariluticola halotolerans]UJQ93909.1 ribose ABC transporter [Mariluticola halotolerans]
MLKGISPLLGPDLLHVLQSMGHGDEIAIVDANYPGTSAGPELVRMDGHSATDVLDAIMTVLPLDEFVPDCAVLMEVVGDPDREEPIMKEFADIIARYEPEVHMSRRERFKFYERAETAYAVVQTGERRLYGNIILKKGVVHPQG